MGGGGKGGGGGTHGSRHLWVEVEVEEVLWEMGRWWRDEWRLDWD